MKTYKQAKIPKGYVEVRMRGSANEKGASLSFKGIIPLVAAGQALTFLGQFKKPKATKKNK